MSYENGSNESKVYTKQQLGILLQEYKGILNQEMIDYLNSLIELEFSVIREYITNKDRKVLSELEIYKKIAIYNIYHRALKVFESLNASLNICCKEQEYEGLKVQCEINSRNINLFDFDYSDRFINSNSNMISNPRDMHIGNILLYKTIDDRELREIEIDRIIIKLNRLYNLKNINLCDYGILGGFGAGLEYQRLKMIDFYEKEVKRLYNVKELSEDDKMEIEITKQVQGLFLDDYGLTDDSFNKEQIHFFDYKNESKSIKKLVKELPNLIINNMITYI